MLAPKNDLYRSWSDVEPLIKRALEEINAKREYVTRDIVLADFIEKHHLPWGESEKSAPTANGISAFGGPTGNRISAR